MAKEVIKKTLSDGREYSVRRDRRRYFYPQEWVKFLNTFKNPKHRLFFMISLHTGARIMEVLNLQYKDIDVIRETVTFNVVKQRKARKDHLVTGKSRSFFVSSNLIREYKSYLRKLSPKPKYNEYIFLDNTKIPKAYDDLDNDDRQKFYASKVISYSRMLKSHLKNAGISDYYNFSPHNIRKTYGMWMRTYSMDMSEICYRMGHDLKTFMSHYGSSLIFTEYETKGIHQIMGNVK